MGELRGCSGWFMLSYDYILASHGKSHDHLSLSGDIEKTDINVTSKALTQILDTAYNLEFNERTSTSAVRIFVERIKQAFQV